MWLRARRNKFLFAFGILIGTSVLTAIIVLRLHQPSKVTVVPFAPRPVVIHVVHPDPYVNMPLAATSAIVVDLTNGQTLFSQKSDQQLPLASLTKLLTLYGASGYLKASSPVVITDTAMAQEGDTGLSIGETFSFANLAKLTLVASSNDGAEAIAEAAEKSQSTDLIQLLASAVQRAHLSQTYALNGTGLDENLQLSGAYGTARDITKLAKELLIKEPDISRATTKKEARVADASGRIHIVQNTNQRVTALPGPLLSKTGYTDLAGGNLVVVFDVAIGHPIAIVVLGSTHNDRFTDVDRLTKATLAHFAYTDTDSL